MHFGEVYYGNVGSETRLDFTVMGKAVNTAARIESLCGNHNVPLLYSDAFAKHLPQPSTLVTEEVLKGDEKAVRVMTVGDPVK